MAVQGNNNTPGDWEFSEDFYKADEEKKGLSLEDFICDDSADLKAGTGSSEGSFAGGPEGGAAALAEVASKKADALSRTAKQVGQVIELSRQGKSAADIAAALDVTEAYIKDIMVCVQAFPEDNPMAVARLLVMG